MATKTNKGAGRAQTLDAIRPPNSYAGQQLFRWIEDHFELDGAEPLVSELCALADRLAEIRAELQKELDPRLVNAEIKVASQYTKVWRLLGLADAPMVLDKPARSNVRGPREVA